MQGRIVGQARGMQKNRVRLGFYEPFPAQYALFTKTKCFGDFQLYDIFLRQLPLLFQDRGLPAETDCIYAVDIGEMREGCRDARQ